MWKRFWVSNSNDMANTNILLTVRFMLILKIVSGYMWTITKRSGSIVSEPVMPIGMCIILSRSGKAAISGKPRLN
jgi:hypothetical protein